MEERIDDILSSYSCPLNSDVEYFLIEGYMLFLQLIAQLGEIITVDIQGMSC